MFGVTLTEDDLYKSEEIRSTGLNQCCENQDSVAKFCNKCGKKLRTVEKKLRLPIEYTYERFTYSGMEWSVVQPDYEENTVCLGIILGELRRMEASAEVQKIDSSRLTDAWQAEAVCALEDLLEEYSIPYEAGNLGIWLVGEVSY